ncbi:type IV pilus biogenesis protein PilP [Trinickia terrae]|uniref:Type IV pilus biogenesis protein PilP n=1 Tax=Trinickia terrae TaxID=2571161 RepID=A0A4U1I1E0_9BURK|nr:type IV pilus biogenesis protein PilP [Trinickia terrae]TKC86962.1 type IV pilus biogenesis protein PilP [Trinickia terrae]
MRNDALTILALACAFSCPAAALAEASAPAADAGTRVSVQPTAAAMQAANELMRLQEDTLLLKAQLKKLDAQAQVAEREQTLHRMGNPVTYGEVSLLATQSLGKAMSATLASSDGSEFDVRAGDTLPDGMRVVQIRSGAVVLAGQDGRRTTLTVSMPAHGGARSLAANNAGPGGVPPIPTLPMPSR